MSSKQNDTIHTGNYEEFFLLYVDGELTPEQVQAVDTFVALHPHLRAELDLLNSACLTPEPLSFPKEELMAHRMQQSLIDEDLFLYMDGELPASRKAQVEQALAERPEYRLQLEGLLLARLDADQTIVYPNKKELYRREERTRAMPWLRAAAAVAVLATASIFYFNKANKPDSTAARTIPVEIRATPSRVIKTIETPSAPQATTAQAVPSKETHPAALPKVKSAVVPRQDQQPDLANIPQKQTVQKTDPAPQQQEVIATHTSTIEGQVMTSSTPEPAPGKMIASINNSLVTSALHNRTTSETAASEKANASGAIASNDHKGSVKGFLRKATRLIERRTGIDPTNDGELLIGVVAVNLK